MSAASSPRRIAASNVFALALSAALLAAASAQAGEIGNFPRVSGTIPFQIQNDYNFDQDGVSDWNNLSTDTEPDITIDFLPGPPNLIFYAHAVLEEVGDGPTPGDDSFFDDTGLFIQDINLSYGDGRWEVLGGKFTPNFGRAWNLAPDLYGQDIAEDYEFDERIGLGGAYTFGDGSWGLHTLSGTTFFLDTTFLSDSIITSRGRTKKSDGGPSNTESLESFAVAYDATALPIRALPGLQYQLGVISQAKGSTESAREVGYVASANASFPLSDPESPLSYDFIELKPLLEFVYFDDFDGVDGQDRSYVTGALELIYGQWDFGATYSYVYTDNPDDPSGNDEGYEASLQGGYTLENGLGIAIGWNYARDPDDGSEGQQVGIEFTYEYDW